MRHDKPRATRLRLTWDPETDVAYLYLAETADHQLLGPTLLLEADDQFAGAVALDFTLSDGRAVGLEFQMASACLPPALLAAAERVEGNAARRLAERGRAMRAARGWVAGTTAVSPDGTRRIH